MSVVEDSTVSRLFKHKIIPHYIWIDSNQIIRAITGTDELTQQNIEKFLDGDLLDVTEKKDKLNYNDQKPYFASGQLDIRDKLLYQSTMTGFIQDAPGGSIRRKNWINCSNHSILHLYKIAFGEFNTDYFNNNRIVLEGFTSRQDSIQIGRLYADPDWKTSFRNYVYCYEIVVPDSLYTTKQMFKLMQQDINKYFSALGLNGRMEKKPIKVLSLIRTSNIDKIKTKGGKQKNEHNDAFINFQNMPIGFITINLQSFYAAEGSLPIINETNYLENIDLKIEANLSDIEAVNKELIRYDLKLIEKEKTMDVIIVRKLSDSNKTSNIPNSSTN
jgi:hypothetical protein